MKICIACDKLVNKRVARYCSNKCQRNQEYTLYIRSWKLGNEHGGVGVNAKNISSHIRRFLFDKYNATCSSCGWGKINPATGKTPLEVDHIDGNADNNTEENLRLICPNCHALTTNYRNLNKGNGRDWRRLKYIKNI